MGCSDLENKFKLGNTFSGLDFSPNIKQTLSLYESYKTFIKIQKYKVHLQYTLRTRHRRYISEKYFNENYIIIFIFDITSYHSVKDLDFFI